MLRRLLTTSVAATAATIAIAASVVARPAPGFVTPTTTTTTIAPPTPLPVIVTPTTPTTSTTSTTTSAPLVIATPTTTTTSPITAPGPVIVSATTTATTSPQLAAPSTSTTPSAEIANPTTTTEPDDEVVLGEIDTSGAVPDGLDLSAVPGAPASPTNGDGPQIAAGFSCAYQCIQSGTVHPRGFGALLVVELHVEAVLFMTVLDDDNNLVGHFDGDEMASRHEWALDNLDPGGTYFVTVAATDDNGDTAYAYGEFETLSERTITLWIGTPVIFGGPTNIISTYVYLKVADLSWRAVDPPEELVYFSLPRYLDLGVHVERIWAHSQYTFCENHSPGDNTTYGNSDGSCSTWHTARLADVDTDTFPAGRSHWTEVEVSRAFETGDGVPPEGAGRRYFDFSVWVTLTIEYH